MARRAFSRAAITRRLFNTPLAVTPDTAAVVLGAIGERFDVGQLFVANDGQRLSLGEMEQLAADRRSEIAARAYTDQRAPQSAAGDLMPVINRIAFVEIRGETVAENGIGPMSGFTGYDGIRAQVLAADADPEVAGIVLDVDSPGGEVAGLYECTAALMARRGTKPMRAVIRGIGASAAYALSCCADEVTVHDLGFAGSVGTILMHVDFSAALAKDGIKVTLIAAGEHKADANPFEPLPDEVADRLAQLVNHANDRFIAHVAAARGLDALAVRDQQAQLFQGEEAVAAGLADKVMSWADSIAEFGAQVNSPASAGAGGSDGRAARPAPGARSKEKAMDDGANAPAADQPEFTQATQNAAVQAAVAAERQRVTALLELDGESTVSEPLTTAIAEGQSAGDFAIAIAKAGKQQMSAALDAARADAVKGGDLPNPRTDAGGKQKVNRGEAAVARFAGKHPGLPAQG